ncbi:MAG: hypothetical protein U0136_11795 [Bdellovibrionota bacterium]
MTFGLTRISLCRVRPLLFAPPLVCLLLSPPSATSEEPPCIDYSARAELANCSYYRSKRAQVPVFQDAETRSPVIDRLALGEEVCWIGEQNGFAILDWDKQQVIRGEELKPSGARAYVRLVELWEPRPRHENSRSVVDRLRDYYYYRQSGGVPEDPFWVARPLLSPFTTEAPRKHCVKPRPSPTASPGQ